MLCYPELKWIVVRDVEQLFLWTKKLLKYNTLNIYFADDKKTVVNGDFLDYLVKRPIILVEEKEFKWPDIEHWRKEINYVEVGPLYMKAAFKLSF